MHLIARLSVRHIQNLLMDLTPVFLIKMLISTFFSRAHKETTSSGGQLIELNSFQRSQNQLADLFNNYSTADKPDPIAKYPKINKSTQMQGSDKFIKDGSYIKIKSSNLAIL